MRAAVVAACESASSFLATSAVAVTDSRHAVRRLLAYEKRSDCAVLSYFKTRAQLDRIAAEVTFL